MKKFIHLLAILALMLSSSIVYASHAVGGDVEYECIGPRKWKIRLTLYRDCTGVPLCSNMGCTQKMYVKPNASLNPLGCSATPNLDSLTLSLVKVEDINKAVGELCGSSAKNGCTNLGQVTAGTYSPSIEKYIFEGTLDLSAPSLNNATCAYWDVYWESCCRNAYVWNLASSSGQGYRIGATINIFNRSVSPLKNNSPIFKNEAVTNFCSGQEYVLNMGAIDPDGDSLTYEIAPAIQQGGIPVNYQPPGSANYPFPLNSTKVPHINLPQPNGPYVVMDSTNGDFTFNALNNTAGYINGNLNIRIKQWSYDANGYPVLVGITQRDLQLYVFNCPGNNPPRLATIPSGPNNKPIYEYSVCAGDSLGFTVIAKDTDVYPSMQRADTTYLSWNQAIVRPGKLTFVPTYVVGAGLPRPREDTWLFSWKTEELDGRSLPYYFTITALDKFCPNVGRVTRAFKVAVLQNLKFTITKTNLDCGNTIINLYKNTTYATLQTASFKITTTPNDRNFTNGTRSIIPISINPQGSQLDSIAQPRLMFADSFRYLQPGKYYLQFNYFASAKSCSNSIIDSIEIYPDSIVSAHIIALSDTSFCFGDSVTLSNQFNKPNYKYQWQLNNSNLPNQTANNLLVKHSGTYRLLITDSVLNCYNFSNEIIIQVNPKPLPNPKITNFSVCEFTLNDAVFVDSSSIASGTYSRLWDFGDGTTSTAITGIKNYISPNNYIVKLKLTSNYGCIDSALTNIQIYVPQSLEIKSSDDTIFCEGKSIQLSSINYPKATYYWYRNNQLLNTSILNNITLSVSGNYLLVLDNGQNCKDTSNIITVQVYPKPKVGFTVNNSIQCLNNNQFLVTDTSLISSGSISRTWIWGSNSSSLPSLNLSFATIGNHQVQLKATSNNGCSDSALKVLTISDYPTVGVIAGLTSGLNTLQAYDYNINQQLNHNYNWVLTNGNIINGQGTNAIKVQWLTAGVGKIKTTITNVNGCSKSDSITVNINTTPTIISFTPQTGTNGTVVTINGGNFTDASAVTFGGVNAKSFNVVSNTVVSAIVDTGATGSVSVVTPSGTALLNTFTYINNTGVAEYVTQSYSIFPNPVSSEIIIESDKTLNNASFELMDVNGKVLITTTCNNATNRFNIDVKTLSPAVYFLRITSQGQTSTVKVVKQ